MRIYKNLTDLLQKFPVICIFVQMSESNAVLETSFGSLAKIMHFLQFYSKVFGFF